MIYNDTPASLRIPYRTYFISRIFFVMMVIVLAIAGYDKSVFGISFFLGWLLLYTLAEVVYIYSYDRTYQDLPSSATEQPTVH